MPSAVARTGVPVGALISTPLWNAPSPENGSVRLPNRPIRRPSTGQMLGCALVWNRRANYAGAAPCKLALRSTS